MILFNTLKKAEHYVRYCQKNLDYSQDGYDWSESTTYIEGDRVVRRSAGDSCGCGCDQYQYSYFEVLGRIKDKRVKSLKQILG